MPKDGSPLISVCIPTYNRADLLSRCLQSVLPQIERKPAEVVVIDNASPDATESTVRALLPEYPNLRYFRNEKNLGYAGNQVKCIEYGMGKYTAILCDDDVYTPDAVETMLSVLGGGDYSFVALNYYSFLFDPAKVELVVGGRQDMLRRNAYEIWDYPSVGHYSGIVLNTALARAAMPEALSWFTPEQFERFRGVLGAVVIGTIKSSSLPGYYIGKPIVGGGLPPKIDYENLSHICLDYYEAYYTLFKKGVVTESELEYRRADVLARLPKALVRNGGALSREKLRAVASRLRDWFGKDPRFARSDRILDLLDSDAVRLLFRMIVRIYLWMKPVSLFLRRRLN